MNASSPSPPAGSRSPEQRIVDFVKGFTIETTPGASEKTPSYRDMLREGTTVAVTFLPGSDFADTVKTARRLKEEGFDPAPHFAARSIPSKQAFEDYLARLQGEVGIGQAVCLAGAVPEPLGPYDSSMALLETGLFEKHGIKTIGVAGHPEGSPDIPEEAVKAALKWKNDLAERSDAAFYVATQFVFESKPIIDWDRAIQAEGNRLPVHIGVPGLATLKTLVNHARNCGIGPSMNFLLKQARNVAKLMTVNAPDKLVRDLANYKAEDPNCGIVKMHLYPLGGMRRSAAWAYAVQDGEFTLDKNGKGFTVTREID
ncbi:MAG: methylenetetrahydrofolate reductase [Rhodovibrionaceae bacterium]